MSISSDFWKQLKKLEEEEEKLSGKTRPTTQTAYTQSSIDTSSLSSDFWGEMNRVGVDIAPTVGSLSQEEDKKWYQKGLFEDGYDFGDITKTILGISNKKELKTFEAPDTTDSLELLQKKMTNSSDVADNLKYTQQYNQMALAQYSDTLSKTKMDGKNHSVLEEIEILANMKKGEEKDKRKQAVLDKMESLGMDSSFYAHFAGDGEFDWNTFGKWLGNSAMAGLNTFNKGLLDTADVLLGAPLKAMGWENNPISDGAEYYNDLYSSYRYNADLLAEKLGGNAWNFASDAVEGTVGALPNALLLFMTGGQSATATTSSLMNNAAMQTGNILTKAGLTTETMLKNPQFWMSFSRTLGSEYQQAKEDGASDTAAAIGSVLSSMLQSGLEIGTDGGSGIQGLPDGLKGGKPLMEWVESSLEEGGEEVLQKFVGEMISKFGYGSDKEILNPIEYAKEGTLGVISGAALGGGQTAVSSGINAYNQAQADKLTDMEQSVKDKIVEKRIAQKEKDGKTMTAKEKADIEKEVERNLRKGYLSADEIEEAIGGEVYESYKAEQDKFFASDAFQKYDKTKRDSQKRIAKMEKQLQEIGEQPNTVANSKKYDAIQNRIELLKKRTQQMQDTLLPEAERIMGIKDQMRSQMMGTVKDSRLAETYRELDRSKQKFQADVSKYTNENAKKTVQSILDSGLGDNSNQFHETVEWLAKLSEERNVTFDLTKTERLKGTKHYREGYVTNGFKTKNGNLTNITINLDGNVLNTTVGHEITHVLEEAGIYEDLSKAVKEFAISKEGQEAYNARLAAVKEIYGEDQTTIDSEITADIIGEYLFTDYDFVHSLSTQNRNVFQKIYDEIKYMVKIATAGSKEQRELERVKKMFDKAWRENVKGKPEVETQEEMDVDVDDVQYSVSVDDKETLDFLNEQIDLGEYDPETNPDGGYYVTYKSMSFWGYDENGNAILRSPMAEYVDGKLSNAYLMPKDKSKLNWYKATETIDEKTGMPSGLLVGYKKDGAKSNSYVPASENQHMIAEDWSNLFFNLVKKIPQKNGKMKNSPVPARYNPYEHSSNSMLNDQFGAAWQRDNLVTVKMYVPRSEDNGAFRAKYSKDATGWTDWKSGTVAGKINKQKDLQRRVYLSRYAAPVEIVPDSEVAQAYKEYISGTDVAIPDNVVSPNLLKELKKAGVPIEESGKVQYSRTKVKEDGNIYSQMFDVQSEIGLVERQIREFEDGDEFNSAHDRLSEAIRNDKILEGIEEFTKWEEQSGYRALIQKKESLRAKYEQLKNDADKAYEDESERKEREAIEKSGLSEGDYFRKKATKEFGYTPYFYDAGYITPNGKMLNFSGEKGKHYGSRGMDHRGIGIIYENTQGTDAMVRFMNDGNIRIMGETPGLDIISHTEPSKEQYATIRKFARESASRGFFAVDFSDESGKVVASYQYDGRVNADRVINDIKYYYETGKTREQSVVGQFHYSMTKAEKAKMDEDYFAAIESGDEEVQRHLVREYAKASMPDSKLVDENGNLRVVYHGTNTGDFTVFNPDYIGMSSGDDGFFGMGFYFAYSKGEASYYGAQRIIPAYLNLTNPFNFQKELRTYNGKEARYGHAPDAIALMNFAEKFPDIAMSITLGAVKNGESTGKSISVFEFAKAFKDIIENKEFDYQEVVNEFGETETIVTADPEVHEYEYNGETHTWRDFGFQKRFMYDHDILDVAYEYLSNAVYSYIDIPRFTRIILDNNREFTAELKARGYDGTIQSEYGDEAVAFYPNQIKSAEPITRDADGNVIPLSKRFDDSQDDIRYSMSKAKELENAYQYDIENDDLLGAEMVVEEMANLAMPDSKIRDNKGRLIPVYHGTNADFWEFDTSADGGKNGTAEGFGIYLSDNQEVTNAYGDRQIKMFANITKPATSFKKTIKVPTLVKLIKQTCERQAQQMVDEEGYDSIKDAIRDTWVSNYVDTYSGSMDSAYREVAHSMIQQNDNDKDIIHEVMFGMAIRSYDQAMDFYNNSLIPVTGIDGFITKWENASTGSSSNIYLAFDSSQLKSADAVTRDESGNIIPLSERFNPEKKDIRYSIYKGDRNTSGDWHIDGRDFGYHDEFEDFAPIREDISKTETTTEGPAVGDNIAPTEEEDDKTPAQRRREKSKGYTDFWADLIGDTSTWVDLPLGLAYKTKTLRRILRKVVRDANGKPDIQKADAIYDALETKYDHNEALLKQESRKLKEVFQKLNLNHAEDQYAQMLGELRHNPDTTLTPDVVKEFLNQHKGKINEEKVNTAIKESRKLYDDLLVRVNKVLREQGFQEIPYRHGYFPHFTNPKQNWLQKALNWKPTNDEIPTSIAGLTEMFKPSRSWQSFNKRRMGDKTDYSLYQGLDTYIHGALDWIYHIEDLQQRRSLENLIRYTHSEEGVKKRIEEIQNGDYDADEAQSMINAVLEEANNPLGGLVRELMNRTNTLANKKSSMDRAVEDLTSRKVYSVMTNLNNRITANQVVGSLSSALTNFIPMVQSWHQVSPVYTVRGMGDYIRSVVKDDGMMEKSDFLTNRLMEEEKLYQTGWDKVSDKAAFMMNVVDSITSNTVWRSKYLQNLSEGMSERAAIKDADQFAKNLMAGRSRGNAPTIFDAKNPLVKMFTAFQLEVANQYGYMFDDVIKDSKSKARLVKGYATAFLGAYAYNALYSSLVGRDAAFDPISIIEDLLKGLFDDEEEKEDVLMDFGKDVLEEVPFVGGLMGGGRIPISSAFPYSGYSNPVESALTDISEGKFSKEWLKPLYYLAMPVAGGQVKKTIEGLGMFSDDHPVTGSYTESGNLRFPVEDTFGNRVQAAMFGQYANKNARDYFDNNRSALKPNQIEEFMSSGMPIQDYWEYRDGLKGLDSTAEKADYIDSLDLPISTKNMLINNQTDRKTPIDLTGYDEYDDFEEFDWATKNPEKYEFFSELGVSYKDYQNADEEKKRDYNWAYDYPQYVTLSKAVTNDVWEYREYYKDMVAFKADKDANGKTISGSKKAKVIDYINSLDIDYGAKLVLLKSQYEAEDSYNAEIFEYIKDKRDLTFEEKLSILKTLGYGVSDDGTVTWD